MLAQLNSETVEAAVVEALKLLLCPAHRELGIALRLLRLLEECPRLVANCSKGMPKRALRHI